MVNVLPTATTDTVAAPGFAAGVPAVSNPTVETAGAGTFSAGDIVQVSGANDQDNDGIFEVESHVGTTLTIRGIGTTATTQSWFANQFSADATVAGTITLVNVNVLQGTSSGVWQTFTGNSSTGLTYTDFTTQGVVDLQEAYEEGNTITTDAGNGNVVITGTELLQITAAGGLDLNTVFDFDGTSFDVQMTGANGFSIDGGAASNVSVDSGDLTLATTTTGSMLLDGVDGVDINSTGGALNLGNDADAQAINIGTGAAARTITMGNATGATAVDFDSGTGAFSFDSTVDETTALFTATTSGAGGDSYSTFVGGLDPSAGGGVAAPVGSLYHRDVGNAGTSGEIYIKTGAAATDWSAIGTGAGNSLQQAYVEGNTIVTDTTNGDFDVSGTEAISLDASASSNFTVDNGQLLLSTTTAGDVTITSASDVSLTGTDNITLDAGAFISLDAVTSSNFTVTGNDAGAIDLTLSSTNAGAGSGNVLVSADDEVDLTSGGLMDVNAGANLDIDVTGTFDMLSTGAFSIDGTGTSNVSADSGSLNLSTTTSGLVNVDGVGGVEINSTGGFIGLGNDADAQDILIGTGAAARTITMGNSTGATAVEFNAGTGAYVFSSTIAETAALMTLTTTGAGGDSVGLFVGDNDPSGTVSADAGSLFMRDTGASGELWLNTSTGSGTAWTQVATGGSVTLQNAYEGGNTIATDTTNGDFDVSGTEAISLDAQSASNFTVDGADLTLSTTTSGNLDIQSAGVVDIDSTGSGTFTATGGALTLETVTSGNVIVRSDGNTFVQTNDNAAVTPGFVQVNAGNATGGNNTGGSLFLRSGTGFGTGNGAPATLQAGGSGAGATGNGGFVTIIGGDANSTSGDAGGITFALGTPTGAGSAAAVEVTGPNNEDDSLFSLASTGTGGQTVEMFAGSSDPSGAVTAEAGSLFMRDTGAGGELWINTSTGTGTTWEQVATGDNTETLQEAYEAGNTIVTDTTNGDFDVSGTEAISLDAQSASNFTVDGADLTLSTTTSGTLDLTSAADIQMTFATNDATAMVIDDGTNNFMTFDSTTGDLAVEVNEFLDVTGDGAGITLTAATTIAVGDLVSLDSAGEAILADSDTGTDEDAYCIGVAATAATATNPVRIYTLAGSLVPVNFAAAPGAAANGQVVFVTATGGEGSVSAPTGSGNIIFKIGILQGADGATTSPAVLFQPQYMSKRP